MPSASVPFQLSEAWLQMMHAAMELQASLQQALMGATTARCLLDASQRDSTVTLRSQTRPRTCKGKSRTSRGKRRQGRGVEGRVPGALTSKKAQPKAKGETQPKNGKGERRGAWVESWSVASHQRGVERWWCATFHSQRQLSVPLCDHGIPID